MREILLGKISPRLSFAGRGRTAPGFKQKPAVGLEHTALEEEKANMAVPSPSGLIITRIFLPCELDKLSGEL